MKKFTLLLGIGIVIFTLVATVLTIPTSVLGKTVKVTIDGLKGFNPATMSIKKGDTVEWVNHDSTIRDVLSGNPDNNTSLFHNGTSKEEFESGDIAPGQSFEHTFYSLGTFDYFSGFDNAMQGRVKVISGAPPGFDSNNGNNQSNLDNLSAQKGDKFLIKMTPVVEGSLFPSTNVTVTRGTVVTWKNLFSKDQYIKSDADLNHFEAEVLDSGTIEPGKTFEHKFNEVGKFPYHGFNGIQPEDKYIQGIINVIDNVTAIERHVQAKEESPTNENNTSIDVNLIQWQNFTNDQKLFSVEYPTNWKVKTGNRFTDDPPLTAENVMINPRLVHSKIEIKVFDSENLTPQKWAELKKRELVDGVKDTKLVEPIRCGKYKIDGVETCSFEYGGHDESGKRAGILFLLVNDNANMTHSITFRADPTTFDSEEPILNHILKSYKLINNYIHLNELTPSFPANANNSNLSSSLTPTNLSNITDLTNLNPTNSNITSGNVSINIKNMTQSIDTKDFVNITK